MPAPKLNLIPHCRVCPARRGLPHRENRPEDNPFLGRHARDGRHPTEGRHTPCGQPYVGRNTQDKGYPHCGQVHPTWAALWVGLPQESQAGVEQAGHSDQLVSQVTPQGQELRQVTFFCLLVRNSQDYPGPFFHIQGFQNTLSPPLVLSGFQVSCTIYYSDNHMGVRTSPS